MTTDIKERLRTLSFAMGKIGADSSSRLYEEAAAYIEKLEASQLSAQTAEPYGWLVQGTILPGERAVAFLNHEKETVERFEQYRHEGRKVYEITEIYTAHPAKTGVAPGTPPTDERIKEIWESFGYRTRFAPHMLRLVRAVLVLIDVAPLQVQDERIAHLERLLSRAKNHIVDWWRPEGSLPPAKSPDLVEDIEATLNPAKGAAK